MTLTRLAELVGTSVATVSKAFLGSSEISEATRERIYEAAKKEGCFDKYYRGPRTTPLFALVFPESESEYYAWQIGILERELSARGADTVIALTRFDKEREARLFRELAYRMGVDGIILSGSGELINNPDEIPLVILGGSSAVPKKSNADRVVISQEGAIDEAISLLKRYGHREVGFIGEEFTASRLRQFKSAMRRHGLSISEEFIATSKTRFSEAGEVGMKKILESGRRPTAIFAAYDSIAYGAMRYARLAGYAIPGDISFIGIDDARTAEYRETPLSSIHAHLEDVASKIADILYKRKENRHCRLQSPITVQTTLVVRESVKKING